jgi:microcystin-dependent protein
MEAFIGTILMWPMNWAPQGWFLCDGTQLPINQYQALFSLIGTTYGGNGTTTFALPDLRGRMPIGAGNGPGLTPRTLGQPLGAEGAALNSNNLPAHTHTMTASNTDYTKLTQSPAAGWTLGAASSVTTDRNPVITAVNMYGGANPANPVQSAPSSVVGSPSPTPVPTVPPALCVNFIICNEGLYPSRP